MNQIVIEEEKLQHNINVIKEQAKKATSGKSPIIIAVLKGNSYGLGSEILANKLIENGIDFFAVSEIPEAIELRRKGFSNTILVLNATAIEQDIKTAIENDLILTCGSIDAIKKVDSISRELNKTTKVHIIIDTGFSRFGFKANLNFEKLADEIKETIDSATSILLEGIYTHFQESYSSNGKRTLYQFDLFKKAISILESKGLSFNIKHCCNSSAFFKYPNMYMDAVRIGSAFCGRLQIAENTGLRRIGFHESHICEIKEIQKGDLIGYSGTYKAKGNMKIAIVEAGYSDGIGVSGPKDQVRIIDKLRMIKSALKAKRQYVTINGKRVPIVGRIGMKSFAVDITNIEAKIGDAVAIDVILLFSSQGVPRVLR